MVPIILSFSNAVFYPLLSDVSGGVSTRRTAFSSRRRSTVMSRPQPRQSTRTSLPARSTRKRVEPQGCFFFSSSTSPGFIRMIGNVLPPFFLHPPESIPSIIAQTSDFVNPFADFFTGQCIYFSLNRRLADQRLTPSPAAAFAESSFRAGICRTARCSGDPQPLSASFPDCRPNRNADG